MERSVTKPTLQPSDDVDDRQEVQEILAKLRASLPELEKLLGDCQSHWGYEDSITSESRARLSPRRGRRRVARR